MKLDLVAFLRATLPVFAQLAVLTETTLDDSAVAFASLALQNQAVADFLNALIGGTAAHVDVTTLAPAHPAAQAAAVAAGFSWQQIIASLPTLINLIKMLAVFGK